MFKKTLWISFIFFILNSGMGYAQDASKAYSWNDDQLFSYIQKFSELKRESDRNNPKRIQGLQSVLGEMSRRGIQKQDAAWNKQALTAVSVLNSSIGDSSYLDMKLSSPLHDATQQITRNVIHATAQFSDEEKAPLINYYTQYGKKSERHSHEVLDATKALTSLGDREEAAYMLERYSEHHDLISGHEAQNVVQAIKEDPRLLDVAKMAIVEGEKGTTASPLEYDLFQYTQSASSEDKKLLTPIWQDALLTTKKPANQYLWADYLVKQGDPRSLKAVFSTRFVEPEQARTLQKSALDKMDQSALVALAQKDPLVSMRDGVAAAPGEQSEDALTADQFQTLAQHLLGKRQKAAARSAAQKSLLASPQEGTNYSNFPSLGLLIDLAHEGDWNAREILAKSYSSPQSTLNDRDRIFTLEEMGRTHDRRFQPLVEEGLRSSSPEVRQAGLQGLASIMDTRAHAYQRVLITQSFDPELRKSAFDGLIEERKKIERDPMKLNTFDEDYKPAIKKILHDASSDSLRVKALNYFEGLSDVTITEDLIKAAFSSAEKSEKNLEILGCQKASFSYKLPSTLIPFSLSDDRRAAYSLSALFTAGVKQASKSSCSEASQQKDFDKWLAIIEDGFSHFNEGIKSEVAINFKVLSKDPSLDENSKQRFASAFRRLLPSKAPEEAAVACPSPAPEEMADIKVPAALQDDIKKMVEKYNQEKNKK